MKRDLTELQKKTLQVVSNKGKSNPITGARLANLIGLKPRSTGKSGADMRAIINALRTKGYPICASGDGYFYPQSSSELSAYIMELQGRVDKIQRSIDGLRDGFDKIGLSFEDPKPIQPLRRIEDAPKLF